MKQALTFTPPILSSTESKLNVEAFDASVEAFENHEYLKSFYALLDYINGDFRTKYGNVQGNEFHIPHGSIIVNIKLDEEKLSITAPFVALPEKGRIPLLRQVAGLNFNAMDLATIYLRDNRLSFEYQQNGGVDGFAQLLVLVGTVVPCGQNVGANGKAEEQICQKIDQSRVGAHCRQ